MPRRKSKKRPCRICRKWFTPNPRVGDRQKTCGDKECMRKWHNRKCAEWNRNNRKCAQENYFHDKLTLALNQNDNDKRASVVNATAKPLVLDSPTAKFPRLPRSLIQEVIGVQQLVIMEYIAQQLFKRVQEVIGRQPPKNTRDPPRQPRKTVKRG